MALDISAIRTTIATPAAESPRRLPTLGLHRRVRGKALAAATRQLAVMLGAGLPVVHSLQLLIEQAESGPLRRTLRDVARRVEAGSSLGDAAAAPCRRLPAAVRRAGQDRRARRSAGSRAASPGRVSRAVCTPATHRRGGARLSRRRRERRAHRDRGAARLGRPRVCGSVREHGSRAAGADAPGARAVVGVPGTPRPARRRRPRHRRDDRGRRPQRARPADPRPMAAASAGHRHPVPQGRRRPDRAHARHADRLRRGHPRRARRRRAHGGKSGGRGRLRPGGRTDSHAGDRWRSRWRSVRRSPRWSGR